jgi:hypothetical protein
MLLENIKTTKQKVNWHLIVPKSTKNGEQIAFLL